jgi:hypothetical protein
MPRAVRFYSFDLLENLVGCAMPTAPDLRAGARPRLQHT